MSRTPDLIPKIEPPADKFRQEINLNFTGRGLTSGLKGGDSERIEENQEVKLNQIKKDNEDLKKTDSNFFPPIGRKFLMGSPKKNSWSSLD